LFLFLTTNILENVKTISKIQSAPRLYQRQDFILKRALREVLMGVQFKPVMKSNTLGRVLGQA
jgi:hypothetical protein